MTQYLNFPPAEYQKRLARTQDALSDNFLDFLLITDDRNFYYFTGFNGGVQLARPRLLLIPRVGDPVIFIAPNYITCMKESSWIEDIRIYTEMKHAPVAEVVQALGDFPIEYKRIGAELGYEQRLGMTFKDMELLKSTAVDFQVIDAAPLVWELRMEKSSLELECIQEAIRITDQAFPIAFSKVKTGMTERAISGLFARTMVECGADGASAYIVTGKGDYFRSMGVPRDRPILSGEMVWADLSASIKGYYSDFSRAGIVGHPSAEQEHINRMIHEVTQIGVEAVKPGRKASEISRILDREMEKRDLVFNSGAIRYGHGMGLAITEPPHIAYYDDTVLKPGMVITIEPNMITEFGRFCVEENILVTETGHKCMSHTDATLWTLE